MAWNVYPLLDIPIQTCTFATDGSGDITVAIAHGLSAGTIVRFSTVTQLPNELNSAGAYYVISSGLTTTNLRVALTPGGSAITFTFPGSSASCFVKTVTIDHTKVPANQTDFPVLVSVTDALLKSTANGGHVQSPSGFDIRPYSSSGLTTPLFYYLVSYDPVAGTVTMRVKVPSLSSSVDTVIYLSYGVTGISIDGSIGVNTFSNGYLGVWPLGDGTTLNVNSATGANNGTNSGATATTGQVDGAANFVSASSQSISCGNGMNPTAITLSARIFASSLPNAYNSVLVRNTNGVSYCAMYVKSNGKMAYFLTASNGAFSQDGTGSITLVANTWYRVTMVYDSVNGLKCYVNGVLDLSVGANGTITTTVATLTIGNDAGNAGRFWNGKIQDVQLMNVAISSAWDTIEVNQGTSSTFLTLGTESSGSIPPNGNATIWKSSAILVMDPRSTTPFPTTGNQIPPTAIYSDKTSLLNTQVAGCDFNGTTITCGAAHGLAADDLVRFWLDQPFSPLLDPNVRYFVLSSGLTTRNFQISLTQGGAPIDFGPPSPDVFLRNYGGRVFPDRDVALFYVKPVLYKKSASFAVVYDDDPWGLFSIIRVVWAFSQHLICTCTDSLNVADSVVGRIQPIRVSATESLSLSETIIAHAPVQLTVTESLTTADVPTRIGQFIRFHEITSASHQLNIATDAPVATLPKMRSVAEVLTVIIEAVQTIGPSFHVTESLALSDNAQRLLALMRTQADALSLSEFVTGSRTNLRLVAEALSLDDLADRHVIYGRGVSEALSIAVSVIGPGIIGVDATDSLSLAQSLSRVWGAGRLASESLLIADLASFLASYHFSATETLLIADSADAARLRPASTTETLLIASAATFGGNYGRIAGETLVLSLAANRRITLRRVVTQLLQVIESPTAASGFAITASEALLIEEWAHWITGPHDPWEYWLDLRTGNLPLESNLDVPEAESIASVPEAESSLDAPEAESELVGNVADSGLRYIDP